MIFVGVRDDLGVAPSHPRAQTGAISIRMALEGVEFDEVPALSPKYARMAPGIRAGECAADHDPGKGFTSIRRPYWGRPCWTLTKTNKGQGLGTILHPLENRSLSIPEAKRLGSFPDEFVLEGKFADRWARIGNSVPPLMMRAIAHHVRDTILGRLAPKTTGGAEAAEHP
jgi:DNA (cytosine-5)-methyltransferase 1